MEHLFETSRLRVRPFAKTDAKRLYEIHAQAPVKQWIPNESYADLSEAASAAAFYADCAKEGLLPFVMAVELKKTCELIGDIGINAVSGNSSEIEAGYVISESCSGRGYASELLCAMTDYVFSHFDCCALYGRVLRGNDASVRVLEKNGFIFIGEESNAEDDPYGCGMLIYRKQKMD